MSFRTAVEICGRWVSTNTSALASIGQQGKEKSGSSGETYASIGFSFAGFKKFEH